MTTARKPLVRSRLTWQRLTRALAGHKNAVSDDSDQLAATVALDAAGHKLIEVMDSSMSKATEVRKEQHLQFVMQTIARPQSS